MSRRVNISFRLSACHLAFRSSPSYFVRVLCNAVATELILHPGLPDCLSALRMGGGRWQRQRFRGDEAGLP